MIIKAHFKGTVAGRRVYRWPVQVTFGEIAASPHATIDDWLNLPNSLVTVLSDTAQHAADYIADHLMHIPCVEVEVFGTRGGTAAHRYWGYDRAIWVQMDREMQKTEIERKQLKLL